MPEFRLTHTGVNLSDMSMDSGVVVAMIAAFASLAVGLGNAAFNAYREGQARAADRAQKDEERQTSARAELDRLREPLLTAALDLAGRIDNIRHQHFLDVYLTARETRRAEIARTSTLYRFARFWCIVELLHDKLALLKFREDEATTHVADTLRDIGRTFATDNYESFMVWHEEQRAIAEKMRTADTPLGCIGYATFVEQYDDTFAYWFSSFEQDLDAATAVHSERFAVLQYQLAVLAGQLDSNHAYREQWKSLMGHTPGAYPR